MVKNTHNFKPIEGKYVNLREVELDDAAFILKLRCDPKKSRFLHPTENNLEKQIDYLKRYKTLDNEWYFIIENKAHEPLGTWRIYDVKEDAFTGGSWLMVDSALVEETMEADFLGSNYAYNVLGFHKCFFDVRKENKRVVKHHIANGAKIVGENDIDYFFESGKEQFDVGVEYTKRLLEYEEI